MKSCAFLSFLSFSAFLLSAESHAESVTLYRYIDSAGVLHLSSKPPSKQEGEESIYARSYRKPEAVVESFNTASIPRQLDTAVLTENPPHAAIIDEEAARNGLDPYLLHALIQVESGHRSDAVSHKGATGLMQLMPATAARYGVTELTDPRSNVRGGSLYLKSLIQRFQDLELALAAYNAGENAVIRYGNRIPPYKETRLYVAKVLILYRKLLWGESGYR